MIDVEERLRSALHELVPLDSRRDWNQVIARAGVAHEPAQSNRRRLIVIIAVTAVLATLVATPAFGVRGALLDLLGRSDVRFTAAPPAASVIKREFADMSSGAPKGMDPRVTPGEARLAATLEFGGVKRHVWVAPTETGGFCYLFEGLSGGCTEIKTDPLILDGGFVARPGATTPAMESLAGRIYSTQATQLSVAFEDGRTMVLPFVYVSEPIGAGFFAYKPTPAEEQPGHRPLAIVVADADGAEIGRETIDWEHEDAKLQRMLDILRERANQTRPPGRTTGKP
jgi:hypothetical protein